jgi:hypothetical protein
LNIEELAREVAEKITFSHASDIEGLTVYEMTGDFVTYNDDEAIRIAFEDEDRYIDLADEVLNQIDKAMTGISWDGGKTWEA